MLLSEYKVDRCDEAGKTCEVVPLEWVALNKQHGKEGKDNQRDNLLDNLQLPEGEGAAKFVATNAVGWNLEAVFKQGDAPADKHDGNNTIALKLRLKGDVAIPSKCHKDI